MTTDAFTLTVIRLADTAHPDDYVVLPERLTKEPVGPVVRSDDEQWYEINKWVLNALFAAEEMGVTRANAARMRMRSEEHTSELQSLMRISYAVFCLKKKKRTQKDT